MTGIERGTPVIERPIVFDCDGDRLIGVLATPATTPRTGMVIVVGGPQYRAGSHRQFVDLARALAQAGIAALRFDTRGMGDSEGVAQGFEMLSDDIEAALVALREASPSVERVALWGLCDGASAALMHVDAHARQSRATDASTGSGLVLVNPWVRSETTFATTRIRHYYLRRMFDPAFWRKLASGRVRVGASLGELGRTARAAAKPGDAARRATGFARDAGEPFQERMASGLANFTGPVLLLMSGRDLTAREFEQRAQSSTRWRKLLRRPTLTRVDIIDADHTFSQRETRLEAERATIEWLHAHFPPGPR